MKINRFIKFLKAINPFIKIPADKNYIKSDSINNGLSKIKSKLIAAALAILAAIPSSNTFAIKKDSSMAQDAKSKKDNSNNQKLKILASFLAGCGSSAIFVMQNTKSQIKKLKDEQLSKQQNNLSNISNELLSSLETFSKENQYEIKNQINLIEEQIKERVNQNQNSGINDLIMQLQTKTRKVFLNEIQTQEDLAKSIEKNISDLNIQLNQIDLELSQKSMQSEEIESETRQLQSDYQEILEQSKKVEASKQKALGNEQPTNSPIISEKAKIIEQLSGLREYYTKYASEEFLQSYQKINKLASGEAVTFKFAFNSPADFLRFAFKIFDLLSETKKYQTDNDQFKRLRNELRSLKSNNITKRSQIANGLIPLHNQNERQIFLIQKSQEDE